MEPARGIFELAKSNWVSEDKQRSLRRKLDELIAIKTDINIQLEEAESSFGRRRKNEVANWLVQVERLEEEFRNLEVDMRETKWSKLWGRRVQSLSEEVGELIGKSRFQRGLVLEVFGNIRETFPVTKLAGAAFQENLEKILMGLMKDENFSIGICGMGGVGKTTLVTHVYNKLLEEPKMFPNVYWITVSDDFSIRKMQDHVARVVGRSLSDQDGENQRAATLSKALSTKKFFFFILDDLWNSFFIEEVGIPWDQFSKRKDGMPVHKNKFKLILTTRSFDVCRMMCCQEKIKLEPLLEKESWNLFVEKLGNYSTLSTEVQMIAKFVAKECDGLPLGIVTMAGSMRGVDDISEWRNVLEELKESNGGQSEMEDKVFQILKYSYARLKDPILQQCFLFCALFPEDYAIKRKALIDYLISEGQLKGLKTRMSQMDKGHTLLNKLENVCLLESCMDHDEDRCIKMHDLIRDMALNIMKESSKAIVQAGKHLNKFPTEIEWTEDLKRVSLMRNDIRQIPQSHSPRCPNLLTLLICHNPQLSHIPNTLFMRNDIRQIPQSHSPRCPNLLTLLICHNPQLSHIPNTLFMQLCGLKILDLSYTGIEVLPSSISNLVHLTCLLLNSCRQLRHIPSVATLETLEKLDLSDTRVEVLPQELEFLSKLIYHNPKDILFRQPYVVELKLFHLQYFNLHPSLAIKGELGNLGDLEYLTCSFSDAHDFYSYFCCGLLALREDQSKLLNKYSLVIGKWVDFYCSSKYLKELSQVVLFCEYEIGNEGQFVVIPKDLGGLFIYSCSDARSLCNVSLLENSASLELLEISRCSSFKFLASSSCSFNIIDCVTTLVLQGLKNLQALIINKDDITPPFLLSGAFSCLKRLDIWLCPNLKSLFPCELLANLQNLEEVKVRCCVQLEAIISQNGGKGDAIPPFIHGGAFSRLKCFQIEFCPRIKRLFPCELLPNLQNREEIQVRHCDVLEAIISQNGGEGAALLPFRHGDAFSCLKRFQIEFCPGIKSLFPCQLLPNLHNLNEIRVLFCGKMEELVASKSEEEVIVGDNSEFGLPKLRLLELKWLPELRSICTENLICDSIQDISVWVCPKLSRIALSLIQFDNEQRPSPLPCLTEIQVFPKELRHSIDWGHPDATDVLQSLFAEEDIYVEFF